MRASRLALVAFTFVFAASPALAGDLMLTKNGKILGNPKAGNPPGLADYKDSLYQITEVTLQKVRYKLRGVPGTQEADSKDIARIFFDPATSPPDMARAEQLEEQGDFAGARDAWQRVAGAEQKWAKDLGAYRVAATYWHEGDTGNAMTALASFKKTFTNSWYLPMATRLNARALLAGGNIKGARAEFESVKGLAGVSTAEKNGADFWVTWIDEKLATKANDPSGLKKAMAAYKSLKGKLASQRDAESVALAEQCQLGVASCQIAIGDSAGAQKDLERMISKATKPTTKAGAHTLMGNALRAQNLAGGDRSVLKEALWHYLRVVCLYGPAEGAEDYHAEAMYKAGVMFSELRPSGATDSDKEVSKRWNGYARREWTECTRRYPNSPWAQSAQTALRSRGR